MRVSSLKKRARTMGVPELDGADDAADPQAAVRAPGSNIQGVKGAHLNPLGLFLSPLGLFLRTSTPFIWRILSAFLHA
jgi:hypothetical protein